MLLAFQSRQYLIIRMQIMSTFVIHPIWPVSKPESMQYGLFRITHQGEQELLRSSCLENLTDAHHRLVLQAHLQDGKAGHQTG
jgi:hypothetical protein